MTTMFGRGDRSTWDIPDRLVVGYPLLAAWETV
jgi:hypothetical protein